MELMDGAVEISKEPMLNGYHIDLKYGESAILGSYNIGLKETLWYNHAIPTLLKLELYAWWNDQVSINFLLLKSGKNPFLLH